MSILNKLLREGNEHCDKLLAKQAFADKIGVWVFVVLFSVTVVACFF